MPGRHGRILRMSWQDSSPANGANPASGAIGASGVTLAGTPPGALALGGTFSPTDARCRRRPSGRGRRSARRPRPARYAMIWPPLTSSVAPVTKVAASEAR